MGLSTLKGNSGYIGLDRRSVSGTTAYGTMSLQKHFLERKNGSILPIGSVITGTIFSQDWEGAVTGWFSANGTLNTWALGTVDPYSGTSSAYISNDAGVSNTYSSGTEAECNAHLYYDFTIPANTTAIEIGFRWKCDGESIYDYGTVMLAPTSFTPSGGVEYNYTNYPTEFGYRVGGDKTLTTTDNAYGRLNSTYVGAAATTFTEETIHLLVPSITAGTTNRLIYSWTSDTSIENNPALNIDNIIVSYTAVT